MTIYLSGKGGGASEPFFNEPSRATEYLGGRYYGPNINYHGFTGLPIAADIICFVPFEPFMNHTFTRLATYNTSNANSGNQIRMGVYDTYSDSNPRYLLAEVGPITLTAAASFHAASISLTLTAKKKYWLAFCCSSLTFIISPVVGENCPGFVTPGFPSFGFDVTSVIGATNSEAGFPMPQVAHTFAALPSQITTLTSGDSANPALVFLKG